MKKLFFAIGIVGCVSAGAITMAQSVKSALVPAAAKAALTKKYPTATKVTWEKEKEILKPTGAVKKAKICR